jgi:hypothetical protein
MNCANHPGVEKTAFCRTCGKPLCANCTREVQGVIYCENCIAERLQGVHPPQAAYPPFVEQGAGMRVQPTPGTGPHPPVAGILASFFPFGVGAVYTGQYAKGLAHLIVFALLVTGASEGNDALATVCGIGIAFFWVYQIIDAVRSARAIQLGQPAPDPFGLAGAFGAGSSQPGRPSDLEVAGESIRSGKVPTAAVVLIGLGILFFLQTAGVFEFSTHRLLSLFLIGLGAWMLAVRLGVVGTSYRNSRYYGSYRKGLTGPVVLITLGTLFLLESFDNGPRFHHTWPVLLLAIGVTKLLERGGTLPPPPPMPGMPGGSMPGSTTAGGAPPSETQPPSNEVKNG